jgi:hypothetical protein
VISSAQRPLPTQDNTTYKHKTNKHIRAPIGIRTSDPSNQPAKAYALDRAATDTGLEWIVVKYLIGICVGAHLIYLQTT